MACCWATCSIPCNAWRSCADGRRIWESCSGGTVPGARRFLTGTLFTVRRDEKPASGGRYSPGASHFPLHYVNAAGTGTHQMGCRLTGDPTLLVDQRLQGGQLLSRQDAIVAVLHKGHAVEVVLTQLGGRDGKRVEHLRPFQVVHHGEAYGAALHGTDGDAASERVGGENNLKRTALGGSVAVARRQPQQRVEADMIHCEQVQVGAQLAGSKDHVRCHDGDAVKVHRGGVAVDPLQAAV
eukprot:ctg_3508.g634